MSVPPDIGLAKPDSNRLAVTLAQRVLGWRLGPGRFLLPDRKWIPTWRFQPTKRMLDAFRLLNCADEYALGTEKGGYWARVSFGSKTGEAHESSQPLAIALAVFRATDLEA